MSTLILAGLLPVTSSGGLVTALRTTGTIGTYMVQVQPAVPTTAAPTADAIAFFGEFEDDNRRPSASRITFI